MPLCQYIAKSGRTQWQHCIILTPACILVTIINIENKQFRGCPKLFCWLGLLICFLSIFLGTWNQRVFYFLSGKSPVQPLVWMPYLITSDGQGGWRGRLLCKRQTWARSLSFWGACSSARWWLAERMTTTNPPWMIMTTGITFLTSRKKFFVIKYNW